MADAEQLRLTASTERALPVPFPLERRRERRVGFVTPTLVGDQRHWRDARSANVSAHGMLLRTNVRLSRGSVLDVYFELPNGHAIQTSGVIVATRGDAASVHFSAIGKRERALLRRFVVERRGVRAFRGRNLRSSERAGERTSAVAAASVEPQLARR